MSIEKFAPSYDILKERVEKIKAALPEAFEDGKINFATLKESLGEFVEGENEETEHYAFTWPGKRQAKRMATKPPQGTLVPAKGEGINEDSTENVFIEGDNLEVLKLLQKSYAGQIKVIYIDPPYNTGKDFIYDDNFAQPLADYLKLTKQVDEEGNLLVSNTKADGRFHTKWLNMIYPRLVLARNLLRDDGIIFISIDDNEVSNLRKLCDEVFGEESFVGNITWEKRTKCQNTETARDQLQSKTEYIFCYKKAIDKPHFNLEVTGEKDYDLADSKGKYREKVVEEMSSLGMRGRETMIFPIKGISPGKGKQWKIGKDQIRAFESRGDIFVRDGKVYLRMRPDDELNETFAPFWSHFFDKDTYGTAEVGKSELSDLLGTKGHGFETVKPVSLIQKLIFHVSKSDDYILDFFAGSGTTAHATLELNKLDKKHRKFILVQLPEPCSDGSEARNAGFSTIAELCKERIRKAIRAVCKKENNSDGGFKVYKLNKSHFKTWNEYAGNNLEELMDLFAKQETTLVDKWKGENLLFEIMLQEGFPLNSSINKLAFKENLIWKITSNSCAHSLNICLDAEIKHKSIEALTLGDKDIFICLDNAVSDEDKVRLSDKGLIKTI
jgi:adenine-specific DNA-methyltransferase